MVIQPMNSQSQAQKGTYYIKVGGTSKIEGLYIAKIKFLWEPLKFKRDHGSPGQFFPAAYAVSLNSSTSNVPQKLL